MKLHALLLSVLLVGCATMPSPSGVAPPAVEEFPQQEFMFRISGAVDAALTSVQDYLTRRGLASNATVRGPKIFVITTYVIEPSQSSDRRHRRTAFRMALSPYPAQGGGSCTALAVAVLTKSRGVREETWSVQDSDLAFESSELFELRKQIASQACK